MAVRKPLKAFAASYDADGFATATPSAFRELEATDTIPVENVPELPQSKITDLETDLAALEPGYTVYTALFTQSGTSDPTVTVLKNTIGSIVWTRNGTGDYRGTLTGAFPSGKTFVLATLGTNAGAFLYAHRATSNLILIKTYDLAGASIDYNNANPMSLEIRVYP